MEQFIFLLATSLAHSLYKKNKGFKKYFIGKTGCSAILQGNKTFETSLSKNGDVTYCHEYKEKSVLYGLICIDLKDKDHTIAEAQLLLTKFMNSLHLPFNIKHATGVNFQHQKNVVKVTDYWQDKNKTDWKITGLTNGKIIAVLYVKNIGECNITVTDTFLNSFTFNTK